MVWAFTSLSYQQHKSSKKQSREEFVWIFRLFYSNEVSAHLYICTKRSKSVESSQNNRRGVETRWNLLFMTVNDDDSLNTARNNKSHDKHSVADGRPPDGIMVNRFTFSWGSSLVFDSSTGGESHWKFTQRFNSYGHLFLSNFSSFLVKNLLNWNNPVGLGQFFSFPTRPTSNQ